jgi:hypothetical protein
MANFWCCEKMKFTLITKNGKIMQFYVQSVAETYRNLYGGVLVSEDILVVAEIQQTENSC